ncbi:hypothetical protein ACFXHA_29695 [Nocardia sp. NPDC059240]|uniref:hypothetical protein n=1 Tax=Nocardia sp. NPDC059240 TaxID=3346786 RepID=UPI0036CD4C84
MRAASVVARLRAVAAASEGAVRLGPGVSDQTIDGWGVPVPADIRVLAQEIGEIWFDEYDPITFTHSENSAPGCCRGGAAGTWWVLHTNGAAETYYADIDPETGAWGRVFSHWEDDSAALVAESVLDWFESLAEGLDLAVRIAAGERHPDLREELDEDELGELDFEDVFIDWFHRGGDVLVFDAEAIVAPMPVAEARYSPDPELAAVAAALPEGGVLADLRDAGYPTSVPFGYLRGGPAKYRRLSGGAFLAAIPSN